MEAAARAQLASVNLPGERETVRACDMRFVGQGFEIPVTLPPGPYQPGDAARIRDAFFAVYAATYGARAFDRAGAIEGVHWKYTARIATVVPDFAALPCGDGSPVGARKGTRPVWFAETGGFTDCAVYDRSRLRAGDCLQGPAIVEERDFTIVLPPRRMLGWMAMAT